MAEKKARPEVKPLSLPPDPTAIKLKAIVAVIQALANNTGVQALRDCAKELDEVVKD